MDLEELLLKLLAAEPLTLRLVRANRQEVNGDGYAAVDLPAGAFQVKGKKMTGPETRFEFNGPAGEVAGYQITHKSGAKWPAEVFEGGPIAIAIKDSAITITPVLTITIQK